ncbi:hypothetical protein JCM16358_25200 [Halanaerocella petrolearia]
MGYMFLAPLKDEIIRIFNKTKDKEYVEFIFEKICLGKSPNLSNIIWFCFEIKNNLDKSKLQKIYYKRLKEYYYNHILR